MPLRPDPLKEMLDLQERMNRLFDETVSRERVEDPTRHPAWQPIADVLETEEAYVVELELPGAGPDDFTVHAHGSELLVRGERHPSGASRPEAFHRVERRHGPFARGFRLPQDVDAAAITARLADGVLRVVLPKARRTGRVRVDRA
ncbi:MAG: Hsp20/alpha crystallin family protein [Vicinamibacteria bacterium]